MEVWAQVEAEAERTSGVVVLAAAQAQAVAARFAGAFVAAPDHRWWWDALREGVPTETHVYGHNDAWAIMREWLPERRSFVLLVSDEEPTPAGAITGSVADLATLVSQCPYFEYVVTDDRATFGIFDTHHNVLIRVGPLPR
jgi:hypothetical protein